MERPLVALAQHLVHSRVGGHGQVLVHRTRRAPHGLDHLVHPRRHPAQHPDQVVVQRDRRRAVRRRRQPQQPHQLGQGEAMPDLVCGPHLQEPPHPFVVPRHQRLDAERGHDGLDALGVLERRGQCSGDPTRVPDREIDVFEDERRLRLDELEAIIYVVQSVPRSDRSPDQASQVRPGPTKRYGLSRRGGVVRRDRGGPTRPPPSRRRRRGPRAPRRTSSPSRVADQGRLRARPRSRR